MLITTYYFACQKIFSFTYLEFVPVFFWIVNLKVFEMQILRSHPRPTELWRWEPRASSPGNSDVQENLRTTALNSKMKLNWSILFLHWGIIVLFFSTFLQFFTNHWKWYFVGVWLQCQSPQYGSVNPACFDGQYWDQVCVQKEKMLFWKWALPQVQEGHFCWMSNSDTCHYLSSPIWDSCSVTEVVGALNNWTSIFIYIKKCWSSSFSVVSGFHLPPFFYRLWFLNHIWPL